MSTWGVITETDDFRGGANSPRTMTDQELAPTFTVMRATSRKRRAVVVIDPALKKEVREKLKLFEWLTYKYKNIKIIVV